MKIQKTEKIALDYGNELYINTYVSGWSGNVELKFNDYASDGLEHHLVVTLPLDKARALVKELSTDLNNYDEEQARKAAEKEEQEVTDE
jgi:hypothetical protein|tara:strand:- start:374 stop:640 length:267 start_codon:yes stop_codon:yes gene_type:complete